MHDVDDEHGQVAQRGASRTQVCERLMARGINDEKAWDFQFKLLTTTHYIDMVLEIIRWEVCRTYLLSDTTSLVSLHICLSELIEDKCLASIYVAHDADDGTTEFSCSALLLSFLSGF